NASWGGYTFNSTALYDAISSARSAGILFVAATGNDNNDNDVNPLYPASYDLDNIIAVAATDRTDNRAWFSNYGARTVDLGAPGAAIFSCWNGSDSDYRYLDGTSMAAPHVVGVCALLWAHYPNDTYLQVKNRVLSNIDPLPPLAGRTVTGGRLNLQKALGGSAPPPALTADFTADPTSGQAPLTVVFSDKSIGNPIALDWDFGDGSAHSSAQNTSHTYNNAGDFTVVLTVAGGNGATSAKSQTIHATSPVPSPLPLPLPLGGATATGQRPAPVSMISYDTAGDEVLDSSQFHFRVSGAPGERYVVEASPNLVDWMPVFTNAVSTFGFYDFTDTTSGTFPQRFYRAKPMAGGPILLGEADYRNDRILVRPLAGVDLSVLHVLLGTRVLQTFPAMGNLEIVQLPAGAIVDNILALFRQSGLVQYAERDFQVQGLLAPNDFRYQDNSLWGLHNTGIYGGTPGADIHAQDAWDVQNTASNIIVAVIDTGVRYTHEDLADNMWVNPGETGGNGVDDDGDGYVDDVHGINAINNTGDPNDDHGHGTHVSGTIGGVGNNTVGVVGVAWKVQIMACKFLDASGIGFISDAIKCIDYARSQGARVVNASWGSTSFNSSALRDAIDSLRQAGIIFVAAAGNSAEDNGVDPIYPASYDLDNIISVAATTRTDELANFSNYGSTTVDLGAPGAAIFSCWNGADNDYKYFDGTSMAAPHVTGTCALLMAHYPGESYQQIINRILSNVDPLPSLAGKCVSGGRLDLQKALGGSPPAPPPEKPTVVVAATDANASEQGPDSGSFTITRAGDTSSALTVNYSLAGTAQNGIDYQQVETSVTIGAGAGSATVTITPIDDNEMEVDETVVLTLSADAAYNIGPTNSATVTIQDNDSSPPPQKPTVTVVATDGDASEQGPDPGEFTFARTGDTSSALTVNYTLGGTATKWDDYRRPEGDMPESVTIPAGATSTTLTIVPFDDEEIEGDETVQLTVSPDAAYDVGSPDTATVTIHDNDQPSPGNPTVTVVASDANASEQGPDSGTFTISRTGDTSSALTVNYTFSGTAQNGTDYQQVGTSITIAAGASSATITVTPIDDTQVEGDETVVLSLSADAAYDVGSPGSATVTIHDNDQPPPQKPTVTVVATDPLASEPGTDTGTFTLYRTGSTDAPLTVYCAVGGTAQNGVDYQALPGSVTIPAGASSAGVEVRPIDDRVIELPELVILTLSADDAYDIGLLNTATVTILDNDILGLNAEPR
ncbi:MAG: hypothetical protein DME18_01195, partial [Verrucomicrobia bacterium]